MMNPTEIVLDFLSAFHHGWPDDLEAALEPLSDDVVVQFGVPTMRAVVGRAAVLADNYRMKALYPHQEHKVLNVGSGGKTVFVERCDTSEFQGKMVDLPLTAVFEVNEAGKITAWREYFDLSRLAKEYNVAVEQIADVA